LSFGVAVACGEWFDDRAECKRQDRVGTGLEAGVSDGELKCIESLGEHLLSFVMQDRLELRPTHRATPSTPSILMRTS